MRSINAIYNAMQMAKEEEDSLSGMNSTSATAIYRLLFYIVAVAIWTFEQVLGVSMTSQNKKIAEQKIHSRGWYMEMSKRFQLGFTLPWGATYYDNTGVSEETIAEAKIVKFCSVTKIVGGLLIKVAKEVGDELAPLSETEKTAFQEYIFRVGAAGDRLMIRSLPADKLKLGITIYYDPLILDSNGARLDGTATHPVMNYIEQYIESIDFDAELVPNYLQDALLNVPGVVIADIYEAMSSYGVEDYAVIPTSGVNPHSGYFKFYDASDLIINYLPNV